MSAGTNAQPNAERRGMADGIATGAILGIAALCVLRTVVAFGPVKWFDVDPAFDPTVAAAWGPAQSLVADALTLALAALVYALCARRMRGPDSLVAFAVLIPAAVAAWHGSRDADDAWRGAGWMAAMIGAASMWTGVRVLGSGQLLRVVVLAVLAAAAGPLLVHAAVQLIWEHSATMADFQSCKDQVFASRGWAPDSPEALSYVRRLEQWEATGWFGLSNILSSLLAALAIAYAGLAFASRRTLERGTILVLALTAAGCLAVVGINGSKGAVGALAMGSAVAVVAGRQRDRSRAAATAALACIALAVAAVVARGSLGEALGERSLLFRWHYMVGAWRAWGEHPLLGTGPAGFAQAYLSARPERAPEEVLSAHSMWVDWITTCGAAGGLWVAVMLAWIWQAAASVNSARTGMAVGRPILLGGICAVAGACALGIAAELHVLDAPALTGRMLGVAFAAVLVVAVVQALLVDSRAAAAGLVGAATLLVVHAQLEMTAWQPGSVAWLAGFVALVAAAPSAAAGTPMRAPASARGAVLAGALASACVLVCACFVVADGVIPAGREEAQAARAAAIIIATAAPGPPGSLRAVPAAVRVQAARTLSEHQGLPTPWADHSSRLAQALDQYAQAIAATRPGSPEYGALCAEALAAAEALVDRAPTDAVLGAAQLIARQIAQGTSAAGGDATRAMQAQNAFAHGQVRLNPRNTRAWIRAGEALQALGASAEAADAYQRALQADRSFELDPLRQLHDAERAQVAARAAELGRK